MTMLNSGETRSGYQGRCLGSSPSDLQGTLAASWRRDGAIRGHSAGDADGDSAQIEDMRG